DWTGTVPYRRRLRSPSSSSTFNLQGDHDITRCHCSPAQMEGHGPSGRTAVDSTYLGLRKDSSQGFLADPEAWLESGKESVSGPLVHPGE
ncbi:mCG145979, partial [Mus musculus]